MDVLNLADTTITRESSRIREWVLSSRHQAKPRGRYHTPNVPSIRVCVLPTAFDVTSLAPCRRCGATGAWPRYRYVVTRLTDGNARAALMAMARAIVMGNRSRVLRCAADCLVTHSMVAGAPMLHYMEGRTVFYDKTIPPDTYVYQVSPPTSPSELDSQTRQFYVFTAPSAVASDVILLTPSHIHTP